MSALSWDAEPQLGPAAPELDRFVGPKLGEVGGITEKEIQLVQDLIETYLRKYVSQQEVAQLLEQHEHVAPKLTELVWLKLEEENAKFFQAYYTRLKLKDQVVLFNHLLEQQVMALQRMPWAAGPPGGSLALHEPRGCLASAEPWLMAAGASAGVPLAPRTGVQGPSMALHAGLPVPGMHLCQVLFMAPSTTFRLCNAPCRCALPVMHAKCHANAHQALRRATRRTGGRRAAVA